MIASTVRIIAPSDSPRLPERPRDIRVALVELLGGTVDRVAALPGGTTEVVWADGDVLQILDSWPEYESYTITHNGAVIVV